MFMAKRCGTSSSRRPIFNQDCFAHTWGMARRALRINVTMKDQKELKKLLSGGVQRVRVVLCALALLQLAEGVSAPRGSPALFH